MTKKCLKCGNNVLPGASTCPSCGNVVRSNLETRQSYNSTLKNNNYMYKRNPSTTNSSDVSIRSKIIVSIIFFLALSVFVYPFIGLFAYLFTGAETGEEIIEEQGFIDYYNPSDYITLNKVEKSQFGEIVMFVENTHDESIKVSADLKYLDSNGSELQNNYSEMRIAPGTEQVIVFDPVSFDYQSYEYSNDSFVDNGSGYATGLGKENVSTELYNGSVFVRYYNNKGRTFEKIEMCVLYYYNDVLQHANCEGEYDIPDGETIELEFEYASKVRLNGLRFDRTQIYLHEVILK